MAKKMVLDLGMGKEEYVAWGTDSGPVFLGGEISRRKDFSEETARQLEEEVAVILKKAYELTETLIQEHWSAVEAVALALLDQETVDGSLIPAAIEKAEAGVDAAEIAGWIKTESVEMEQVMAEADAKAARLASERRRHEAAAEVSGDRSGKPPLEPRTSPGSS
jgi:cell division protease FtsH